MQKVQDDTQGKETYKLPAFDVEEEKPIEIDVDEDWPVEYLLANAGGGGEIGEGSGYPSREGFEVYAFAPENVRCGYDNTNGFSIKISDTGSEDWHIQLKKNGVKVENGKWYQVTFDAKSSIERSIIFSMQRDGTADEDWRSYSGNKTVQLGNEWKPYTIYFRMTDDTDEKAIYNFSMGTVGGNKIRQQHTVNIKNMKLNELEDTWFDHMGQEGNLLKNSKFEYDDIAWEASVVEPGAATVKFENGKAVFDISNVGTLDWHVQLKQDSIPMEHGYNYRLTFKASSTASRSINIGFMDKNFVNWYGGGLESLNAAERTVAVEFYMDKATDKDVCMFISMGKIENMNTPASVITLSDFSLEKLPGRPTSSGSGWSSSDGGGGDGGWVAPIVSLSRGWSVSYWFGKVGQCYEEAPGSYLIEILDTGSQDWHVQMQKKGILVKNGKRYRMSFEAKSSINRKIGCAIQKDGTDDDDWTSYSGGDGKYDLTGSWQTFSNEFTMTSPTDRNAIYNISLGAVDRVITQAHTVCIRNLKLEELPDEPVPEDSGLKLIADGDDNILKGKNFSLSTVESGDAKISNDKTRIKITNVGNEDYSVQLKCGSAVTLEKDAVYVVKGKASFTSDESETGTTRKIAVALIGDESTGYDWYGGITKDIGSDGVQFEQEFTMEKSTNNNVQFVISMGQMKTEGANPQNIPTPKGTLTLSELSLEKKSGSASGEDDPDDSDLKLIADVEGNLLKGIIPSLNGSATINETKIEINDVGSNIWDVQLLFDGLSLKSGEVYTVTGQIKSSVDRKITVGVQKPGGNPQYGGDFDKPYTADSWRPIEFEVNEDNGSYDSPQFYISMGKFDTDTPAGMITISNLSLVKKSGSASGEDEPDESNLTLIADGDDNILKDYSPWVNGATRDGTKLEINSVGDNKWDVQLGLSGFTLDSGATYTATCRIKSSVSRQITVGVQGPGGNPQYGGEFDIDITADSWRTFTFNVNEDNGNYDSPTFYISMGSFGDSDPNTPHTITVCDISLVKKSDVTTSSASINTLSTASKSVEEELVEDVTNEEADEEIKEEADEEPEADEEIKEDADEGPKTEGETPEDAGDESGTDDDIQDDSQDDAADSENTDIPLKEVSNDSSDGDGADI